MTVERIGDPRRWREVRDEWDGVVLSSARPSIYAAWDFLDASWTHFAAPRGDELAAFVVRDGGRAIGVAGYRLARRWPPLVGLRRLCALGSWESDRPAPAFESGRESESAAALLEGLESCGAEWDVLDWCWAPVEHHFTGALRAWARASAARQLAEEERSASAVVELPESWEEYLARWKHSERSSLRRHEKRLTRLGAWEGETYESETDILRGLELFLAIEARSWKPAQRQGVGRSPRIVAFYRDLLVRLARQGRACVSLLRAGPEWLSGEISLRLGDTFWGYQTAYDSRFRQVAPGVIIKTLAFQKAIRDGARRYELMALFPEDKRHWTPIFQPNAKICVRRLEGARRRLFALLGSACGQMRRSPIFRQRASPKGLAASGPGSPRKSDRTGDHKSGER